MGLFDSKSEDKAETIRRLTMELMAVSQKQGQLMEDQRTAHSARRAAVNEVLELKDVLRLKEELYENLERRLSHSQDEIDSLRATLAERDAQLAAIRAEQEHHPLSDLDLLDRHQRQSVVFEQLQEALSCPICYEPFARNQMVALLCGHAFCAPCFSNWEHKHLDAYKTSPSQGAYLGPECPECRSTDVRRGRVRVWAMEETVRLVERGMKERKVFHTAPISVPPAVVDPTPDVEMEDEAARLLRPRTPLPYAA